MVYTFFGKGKSLVLLFLGLFLCATGSTVAAANPQAGAASEVLGAGASFPAPVYSKWATEYRTATGILVNYQSIGSGGGVKQIQRGLVDFGASDYPLTPKELQDANLYQFPALGGGIVIAVNLRELSDQLILDGATIADIYAGKITKWNDPQIAALNPTIADKLPDIYIAVLFRSDASGTTYNFTKYLAEVSPSFKAQLGYGKAVNFPVGLGGKGNEGVAAVLPRVYGTIGYLEYGYAESLHLGTVAIKNLHGKVVRANLNTFSRALAAADWSTLSPNVNNTSDPEAWPINSLTYILVKKDSTHRQDVKNFFSFGMLDKQEVTRSLDYVPLSTSIAKGLLDNLVK